MHFKILLITLAFAISLQMQDASVQQQRSPNITDIRTSMEISQKTTLSQALVLALSDTGMAGGIVNTGDANNPQRNLIFHWFR